MVFKLSFCGNPAAELRGILSIKNIFDIGWEEVKRLNKNLAKKRANDGAKTKRVLC